MVFRCKTSLARSWWDIFPCELSTNVTDFLGLSTLMRSFCPKYVRMSSLTWLLRSLLDPDLGVVTASAMLLSIHLSGSICTLALETCFFEPLSQAVGPRIAAFCPPPPSLLPNSHELTCPWIESGCTTTAPPQMDALQRLLCASHRASPPVCLLQPWRHCLTQWG